MCLVYFRKTYTNMHVDLCSISTYSVNSITKNLIKIKFYVYDQDNVKLLFSTHEHYLVRHGGRSLKKLFKKSEKFVLFCSTGCLFFQVHRRLKTMTLNFLSEHQKENKIAAIKIRATKRCWNSTKPKKIISYDPARMM